MKGLDPRGVARSSVTERYLVSLVLLLYLEYRVLLDVI